MTDYIVFVIGMIIIGCVGIIAIYKIDTKEDPK